MEIVTQCWLRAASLLVMGNLGLSILEDAVEMTLWGDLPSLGLDSLNIESLVVGDNSVEVEGGLSALIFSSVLSVGGTGHILGGNSSCTGDKH